MEKCGKLFCVGGDAFEGVRRLHAAEMVRGRGSIELRACSACAGDYEDPDRTAGEEFEEMLAGDEAGDSGPGDDECE